MSDVHATASLWSAPEHESTTLPHRADVIVIGAGMTGLSIASRLFQQGIDVLVVEKRPYAASGMATRGLGIASVMLLDPPFRLIQAVGTDVAKQITRFTRESVAMLGPRLNRVGVGYLPKGAVECGELEANLHALDELGIRANRWSEHGFPELGTGWRQPMGGTFDPQSMMNELVSNLPVATGQHVIDIEDSGFDLQIRTRSGVMIQADVVIMTGGAQLTPWATSKFYPVRHQALATEPTSQLLPCPIHMQYGYTSVRQAIDGRLIASGCRWASPHLEVGETDDTIVNPNVHARLSTFLRRHIPLTASLDITHQWTAIMTFSCDGLPVIGPLPGRPRIISCGGFGAFGPSLSLRAAKAVTDGITTGRSPGVPECFSTRRFD